MPVEQQGFGIVARQRAFAGLRGGGQRLPGVEQLSLQELMGHQELKGHPVLRIGLERLPQQRVPW